MFVQNFRPGTLDRHGLGYDDLRAGHDDLVYVSLSGFGAVGPYAGKSALRHGDPGLRRVRRQPGRSGRRHPGVPAPDRGRQGHRASPPRRPSPPRCSPASAVTAASTWSSSMLDAVVSFLWADAAGNEVLHGQRRHAAVELRRHLPAVPVPRRVRHRHAHERRTTSSASCARSTSRAPKTRASRRSPSAVKHGDLVEHDDEPVLRGRGDAHHRRSDGTAERAAGAVRCGALARRARRRRARAGDRPVRRTGARRSSGGCGSPAIRSSSRGRRPSSVAARRRSASTPTRSSPRSASATAAADLRAAGVVA